MESMLEGMLNDICGKDLFSEVIELLRVNLFAQGAQTASGLDFSTVLTLVRTVYTSAIQPVALLLMMIYFVIALVDKMTSENFTWEQMGRQMCLFLAAFYLINHGLEIMGHLFDFGVALVNELSAALSSVGIEIAPPPGLTEEQLAASAWGQAFSNVKEVVNTFKESIKFPIAKDFILFVYLLIPWLLAWIMGLIIKIICYTRIIEIYIRAAFAPVALADFFQSGFQGAGWRFLKSFFAACIQGGIILAIAAIYSALFHTMAGGLDTSWAFFKFLGMYLALMASAVMLMFKSQGLAKEFIGVS